MGPEVVVRVLLEEGDATYGHPRSQGEVAAESLVPSLPSTALTINRARDRILVKISPGCRGGYVTRQEHIYRRNTEEYK